MAKAETVYTQPAWDFPRQPPARREVIPIPERQPSYPPQSQQKPERDRR